MPLKTRTLAAATAAMVAVAVGATTAQPVIPTEPGPGAVSGLTVADAARHIDLDEPDRDQIDAATPVAAVDDVQLLNPQPGSAYVGFHQAAYTDSADMQPGHGTQMLPSRGRTTGPASALDVAATGKPVLSPVTGRVSAVIHYQLYGEHDDVRIEITPAGRTDLTVVVLHVTDPQVDVGQAVVAGHTVVADQGAQFPFESQIDRFVDDPGPHVHLEVKRR